LALDYKILISNKKAGTLPCFFYIVSHSPFTSIHVSPFTFDV
jgi:hypothetical protein